MMTAITPWPILFIRQRFSPPQQGHMPITRICATDEGATMGAEGEGESPAVQVATMGAEGAGGSPGLEGATMDAEGAGGSPAVQVATMGAEGASGSPAVEGATSCTTHVETSVGAAGGFAFISLLKDKRALSANDRARIITSARADSMIFVSLSFCRRSSSIRARFAPLGAHQGQSVNMRVPV